jgi:hypothetical protein
MAEPKYAKNPETGERAVSFDDGKTWEAVDAVPPPPPIGANDGAGADPEYDAAYTAAMAEGGASAPAPQEPNPLAPDYYDAHPLEEMASAPAASAPDDSLAFASDEAGLPSVAMDVTAATNPLVVGMRNPFGGGAEAVGFGAKLHEMITGVKHPRQVGRGFGAPLDTRTAYEIASDTENDLQAAAAVEDPSMHATGRGLTELAASAPSLAVSAPAAAGRFGAAKVIGANAVPGAVYGGATGGLSSEAEDASGVALDAVKGTAVGGGTSALLGGALNAGARGIRAAVPMGVAGAGYGAYKGATEDDESVLGGALKYGAGGALLGPVAAGAASMMIPKASLPGLQKWGRIQRASAPGAYGSNLASHVDEAQRAGMSADDAMAALGEDIERVGLDKQEGWRRFLPWKSNKAYHRDGTAMVNDLGPKISGAVDDATAQGVTIPRREITGPMLEQGVDTRPLTKGAEGRKANLYDLRSRVKDEYGPEMTPRDAFDLKRAYEQDADFAADAGDMSMGATYRDAAKVPRSALHEAMGNVAPDGLHIPPAQLRVPRGAPELQPQPTLKSVELPSTKGTVPPPRGMRARKPNPAPEAMADMGEDVAEHAPSSFAIPPPKQNFVSPETSKQFFGANRDYPIAKFVADTSGKRVVSNTGNQQASLLELAPGSLSAAIAMRASRMGGKDMAANAARGLVQMAQSSRGINPWAPTVAGMRAAGQDPRPAPPVTAPAQPPTPTPKPAPKPMPQAQRSPAEQSGEGRGHALPDTIRQTLESDPAALGDYGPPLQQAIDSGDELRLNAEIAKLQEDPKFRQQYGAQLRDLTRGAR